MPELPEVETVRRGLVPLLVGRRIAQVELKRPDLRFPLPERFAERVTGRRIDAIKRQGKFLLIRLDDDVLWLAHLGMSGRFRIDIAGSDPDATHDHLVMRTDEGSVLRFHDPRRFGFMDLLAADASASHPMLARLGPDPFSQQFSGDYLTQCFSGRRTSLKAALLDQRNVAGMGNIYASESLFRARMSPTRQAMTVVGRRALRLADAIRAVFSEAIAAGGSSLRDHRQPSGELGYFQHYFAVYGRAGSACPGCSCDLANGGGIHRVVQNGRSTFYCPTRQH